MSGDVEAPKYITTQEFADLVRAPVATIRFWRHAKYGPQSFKLGRRVLFDRAEVLAWIEAERARQNGTETGPESTHSHEQSDSAHTDAPHHTAQRGPQRPHDAPPG